MSLILYPNIGATNRIIIIWFDLYLIITSENRTYPLESYYILQTIIDSFELPKMGSKKYYTEENAGLFLLACYLFLCNSEHQRSERSVVSIILELYLDMYWIKINISLLLLLIALACIQLLSLVLLGSQLILLFTERGLFPFSLFLSYIHWQ